MIGIGCLPSFFIAAPLFLSSLQFHLLLSLQGQLSLSFSALFSVCCARTSITSSPLAPLLFVPLTQFFFCIFCSSSSLNLFQSSSFCLLATSRSFRLFSVASNTSIFSGSFLPPPPDSATLPQFVTSLPPPVSLILQLLLPLCPLLLVFFNRASACLFTCIELKRRPSLRQYTPVAMRGQCFALFCATIVERSFSKMKSLLRLKGILYKQISMNKHLKILVNAGVEKIILFHFSHCRFSNTYQQGETGVNFMHSVFSPLGGERVLHTRPLKGHLSSLSLDRLVPWWGKFFCSLLYTKSHPTVGGSWNTITEKHRPDRETEPGSLQRDNGPKSLQNVPNHS